jgi:hypothetical protein
MNDKNHEERRQIRKPFTQKHDFCSVRGQDISTPTQPLKKKGRERVNNV